MTKEELIFKKERIKKQIENEQKAIEEIDKELKRLDSKKWKPKIDEKYFYVDYKADFFSTQNNNFNIDKRMLSIGNYFKTREEAEFELERLKVLEELKEFSYEFSDEEWENSAILKYQLVCFYGKYNEKGIGYTGIVYSKHNGVYFKTKEDVKKAIKKIGEDRLKKYYFKVGK